MVALAPLTTLPGSDRVELRPHTDADLGLIELASHDPLIPNITTVPRTWSEEAGWAYLARQARRPAEGVGWSLAIVDRATGQAVGNVYISLLLRRLGVAEIGYWIAEPYRRQGLAAEALKLVVDWAPAEFGLDELFLFIEPWNDGSLGVAAAAGFVEQATLNCWQRWNHDSDEWRPLARFGQAESHLGDVVTLGQVEMAMWTAKFRGDPTWFGHWIHDDFFEYGRSGTHWTREKILAQEVAAAIEIEVPFPDLKIIAIDDDLHQVCYRSIEPRGQAWRSSLWQRCGDQWRMRFHQGTPIPD